MDPQPAGCPFAAVGCTWAGPPASAPTHARASVANHLELLLTAVTPCLRMMQQLGQGQLPMPGGLPAASPSTPGTLLAPSHPLTPSLQPAANSTVDSSGAGGLPPNLFALHAKVAERTTGVAQPSPIADGKAGSGRGSMGPPPPKRRRASAMVEPTPDRKPQLRAAASVLLDTMFGLTPEPGRTPPPSAASPAPSLPAGAGASATPVGQSTVLEESTILEATPGATEARGSGPTTQLDSASPASLPAVQARPTQGAAAYLVDLSDDEAEAADAKPDLPLTRGITLQLASPRREVRPPVARPESAPPHRAPASGGAGAAASPSDSESLLGGENFSESQGTQDHEQWYSKLEAKTVSQLKTMLKYNALRTSGTKDELVERIVEAVRFGCLQTCPSCRQHLKPASGGRFRCPGRGARRPCTFSTSKPVRHAWRWSSLDSEE